MCAKVKFTYPPRCGVYDRSGCSYCCPEVIRWPFIVWWIFVVGLAIVENRKGNKYLKQHVFPQMLSFLHWRMKGLDRVLVTLSLVASIYPLASRMKPATRAFSSCSLAVWTCSVEDEGRFGSRCLLKPTRLLSLVISRIMTPIKWIWMEKIF